MKSKKWFLLIALCLCFGVMAIGIYAAATASLNITGNLGFTMHEGMVTVKVQMQDIAVACDNGTASERTTRIVEKTIKGSNQGTTTTLDLGEIYFYYGAYDDGSGNVTSKVYDIVFNITVTNISTKPTTMKVPMPTVADSGIEIVHGTTASYYTTLTDGYETMIGANSSTTVKFALRLIDTDYESWTGKQVSFNLSGITFSPFYKIATATDANELIRNKLYVEMGEYNGEPIRWYAFAKENASGVYESLLDVNFNSQTPTSGSYYFISEYMLGSCVFHEGMESDLLNAEYNYSLLKNEINELSTTYSFTNTAVYKQITKRNLEGENYYNEDYVPDVKKSADTLNQKLWALSINEYSLLVNTSCEYYEEEGDVSYKFASNTNKTYGYAAQISTPTITGTSRENMWWLRTPIYDDGQEAGCSISDISNYNSYYSSCLHDIQITIELCGIRPGFQLSF
ncbi:MAG: hypothetical protein E7376_03450 [Clostridiales bacterium]|nr:hypothetical protein [Clostridiales bacterium]